MPILKAFFFSLHFTKKKKNTSASETNTAARVQRGILPENVAFLATTCSNGILNFRNFHYEFLKNQLVPCRHAACSLRISSPIHSLLEKR